MDKPRRGCYRIVANQEDLGETEKALREAGFSENDIKVIIKCFEMMREERKHDS